MAIFKTIFLISRPCLDRRVLWCHLIHFSKRPFCWPAVNNLHSDPSLSMHYPKRFLSPMPSSLSLAKTFMEALCYILGGQEWLRVWSSVSKVVPTFLFRTRASGSAWLPHLYFCPWFLFPDPSLAPVSSLCYPLPSILQIHKAFLTSHAVSAARSSWIN